MAPVLILLLAALVFAIYMYVKSTSELRAKITAADEAREAKRLEAETARAESREKREELERLRDELQETRTKLRKAKEKDQAAAPSQGSKPAKAARSQPTPSATAIGEGAAVSSVVRISNQELEAEHRAKVEAFEAELSAARAQVAQLERRETERQAAFEQAKKKLEQPVVVAAPTAPAPTESRRPEEKIAALETQLEALDRASGERERLLKREVDKLGADLRAAEKRASANQQLYQVAKGQMIVIEDRLAALRRKHEGAIAPDQLRKAAPEAQAPAAAPVAEPAAPAAAPQAPAADQVEPATDATPPTNEAAPTPASDGAGDPKPASV